MRKLHILQGGVSNGDKSWLEKAARAKLRSRSWIAPKSVEIGDDAVIYITGYGFYATAQIDTLAKPRANWRNRYGAGLRSIKLIRPAISLAEIRKRIPKLTWAKYPRSITTPQSKVAAQIKRLISVRVNNGVADLDDDALIIANIDELRRIALLNARSSATQRQRKVIYRVRSKAIHLYVLARANGRCEGCEDLAPFLKTNGSPYLEPHHTMRLADDGPDHPDQVIGLCPNCHRRAHHAKNANVFNRSLIKKLTRLESHRSP